MSDQIDGAASPEEDKNSNAACKCATRKEKRQALKKQKRKQLRKEVAIRERVEEEARLDDPEEQLRVQMKDQEEAEIAERERKLFEERERLWLEAAAAKKAAEEEERRKKFMETSQDEKANELDEDDEWDYIEEGPAEIIWKGNEIIVKKNRIRVPKGSANKKQPDEDVNRPTSNPLPPQSVAFASYMDASSVSAQEALERVAQEVPNFGTEQDKAHCPFHLKTGVCRFGSRCSRVHFHPDKSCTLLIKNMYNGPGLAWDQDEGLEYTDEEVERCYEEFYEDVHTEFLKFGELVNFKVCNNGSYHLHGNLYVHYKSLDSAVLAYNNTNGRYFAGKQITCEFVSLTRWKAAICGEYMKSRLKTCSHGSACNFIHCFRNPGGDYEWADWDNPPPKYWIRKMVALFGPSNDYENDKDYRESERQRCSSRNRTATNKGSHSLRSDSSDSPAKDSDMMRDQPSRRSNRREQSSRSSRGKAFLTFMEKYERPEKYDESAKRHRMHSYDSSEDIYKENDRVKYPKYEDHYYDREKFKHRDKEDFLRQKRGRDHSNEHMKSKRYTSRFHEKQECIQTSDYTDDDRELSDGHSDSLSIDKSNLSIDDNRYYGRSHDQSSNRLTIDEERYTGRSVEEVGSNADSTCVQQSACPTESRKHNQYISPRQLTNVSRDQGSNGRNSAFRSEGSDPEGAHDHLPHRSSRKRKHDDSRKRNHHREKGENKGSRDEFSNRRKDEKYCSRYSSSSGRKFNEPINYDS